MIASFEDIKDDAKVFCLKQDTFIKVAAAAFERLKSTIAKDKKYRTTGRSSMNALSLRRAASSPYQSNQQQMLDWHVLDNPAFQDRRKVILRVHFY